MGNVAKVLRAGRAGVPRDLDELGVQLVSELRLDLSKPGQGRVYTTYFFMGMSPGGPKLYAIGKRDKPHRASAPGDPPAVDEGVLRASYGHSVERTASGGTLTIGSGDEKAPWLEFGTSRMKPRPHVRPLMARNRQRIRDHVATGIERRERLMAKRLGGKG
jgi:hypothetical protein